MPVRKAPLLENKYYHIFNRGFEKQIIFRNKSDFERFLILIQKYIEIYNGINFYSYSILPNHFHFIIRSSNSGIKISNFMSKLQQSYSMYFKIKYKNLIIGLNGRSLFEGRFKAKLIKDDDYLIKCLNYINYNPLKHGIVDNIDDYAYTSIHQLLGKSPNKIKIEEPPFNQTKNNINLELPELEF